MEKTVVEGEGEKETEEDTVRERDTAGVTEVLHEIDSDTEIEEEATGVTVALGSARSWWTLKTRGSVTGSKS